MPPKALEQLRLVNDNLRSALSRLHPGRRHCSTIKPQDFSDLRNQLLRAAECLRYTSHLEEPNALEKEALEYRGNLEKLKRLLPEVHVRLLAEKERLETARTHLAAATEWARSREKST
jgi:hypothetical protein